MKLKTTYICSECGAHSPRWLGKCPTCNSWNTYIEEIDENPAKAKKAQMKRVADAVDIVKLKDVEYEGEIRILTGMAEFDRTLGGGIVPGSIVLIGGDPGIGKSTLLLQVCGLLGKYNPLYITGEESLRQIKYRSERLSDIPGDLMLLAETSLEKIIAAIKMTDCGVVVVDSIQSVTSDLLDASPGSVLQVRTCASELMKAAKQSGKPVFIVGHITKEGVIAGPKVLEHLVDTVLQFEGERTYSYRILRSVKNRFGSTNEIGIFEMEENGLIEVKNPSEVFLGMRNANDSGVAVVASIEGTRPILLEMQALVTPTSYGMPQRTATGFDLRRLQMIIAVLEKRLGANFRQHDIFVNVAGGMYLNDTAVDLGIAAALLSSLRDTPIDSKTVLIGEIGLTGEVRAVSQVEQRIAEAEKLGFSRVIAPTLSLRKISGKHEIELISAERISLATAALFY